VRRERLRFALKDLTVSTTVGTGTFGRVCVAQHLPSKVNGCVRRTAGEALALKPKLADNVGLKLRPFMAARPARRETNAA
jgi:hypothetical protein